MRTSIAAAWPLGLAIGVAAGWLASTAGAPIPWMLGPLFTLAVLGLVTSKTGALEDKDALRRRIDAATQYVSIDQLALSPQCGFASTEEGNVLTYDQQRAKLALIVEVAQEVWG